MGVSSLPEHTAPGGASTSHGILVQTLWSLFRLAPGGTVKVVPSNGSNDTLHIILEPSDGGDLRLGSGKKCIVEQVKSRSDGGTWSFNEFVTDVLPDLFKATSASETDTIFRFVTNGKIGEWTDVKEFIESLDERTFDETLASLDNEKPLEVRRHNVKKRVQVDTNPDRTEASRKCVNNGKKLAFEFPMKLSEQAVFRSVASFLCQKSVTELGIGDLRRVWSFLAAFEFETEVDFTAMDAVIDEWLAGQVELIEKRSEVKKAMLTSLWQKASAGNGAVSRDGLLDEFGINGVPLNKWQKLITKNRDWMSQEFETSHFIQSDEVRHEYTEDILKRWQVDRPVLVLVGESGQGKSWLGNSLLHESLLNHELAWRVDATGEAQRTLQAAADVFWHELVEQDLGKPLSRIRARFRELYPDHRERTIRVLFDNVTDPKEGVALAKVHWNDWGIRIAITCRREVGEAILGQAGAVCMLQDVPDFSETELREYLDRNFGDLWPSIPVGIRDTLRRPLLANLYRDLATVSNLAPNSEYALYSQVWSRLTNHPEMVDFPNDVVRFRRLIGVVFDEAAYPWTSNLLAQRLDSSAIVRLQRIGWLTKTADGHYRVWHDRLLNWGMAENLWANLVSKDQTFSEVCALAKPLLSERRGGVFWGYVLMDLLWLATTNPHELDFADAFLIELERLPIGWNRKIYLSDIANLGSPVVPVLFRRLEAAALGSDRPRVNEIAKALARIASPCSLDRLTKLLTHPSGRVQRAGLIVLHLIPDTRHLDRIWQLHCDRERDFLPFAFEHESSADHFIYKDSMNALRSCVRRSPHWIAMAVQDIANKDAPIWDLAYLIASSTDCIEVWNKCKHELFRRVATDHPRCLAVNCGCWKDEGKLNWLIENIANGTDGVASSAFHALTLIDARRAIDHLQLVNHFATYASRSWWLPRLVILHENELITGLVKQVQRLNRNDGAHLLRVFQGFEDEMPPAIVDLILDQLSDSFDCDNKAHGVDGKHRSHMIEFDMLVKVARRDSLECFRSRRDTKMEIQLRDWLLLIGAPYSEWHFHEQYDGLRLLARIGGDGFTAVLNSWLNSGEYWGRWSCRTLAGRRPDLKTIELLERRTECPELHPGSSSIIEDSDAAEALAAFGEWDKVCRYVRKAACRTNLLVAEYQADQIEFSENLLRELRDADAYDPGVVMAMGFTGRTEFLGTISAVLQSEEPDTELARACAFALTDLKDKSLENVPVLNRMLTTPQNAYPAIQALVENGTPYAIECLIKYCENEPWFSKDAGYSSSGIWLLSALLQNPHAQLAAVKQAHKLFVGVAKGSSQSYAGYDLLR